MNQTLKMATEGKYFHRSGYTAELKLTSLQQRRNKNKFQYEITQIEFNGTFDFNLSGPSCPVAAN